MSSEKFCLRWNDFESNISVAFRELRDDKDFFDVTLACDDEQIQAHKVILSACSPFFRNVLRRNPHQHPLLYLKGVKFTDLQSVLNFMYHGEVNVAQEELNSFLAVAEDLRVKGLTQNNQSGSQNKGYSAPKSPPSVKSAPRPPDRDTIQPIKRPRPSPAQHTPSPANHSSMMEDDDIQEVVPVKSEPRDPAPPVVQSAPAPMYNPAPIQQASHALAPVVGEDHALASYQEEGYEDYGQYDAGDNSYDGLGDQGVEGNKVMLASGALDSPTDLLQYIVKDAEGGHACGICPNFVHKSRANVRNHVESKHFPNCFVYTCQVCAKTCPSHQALLKHKSLYHKGQ